MPPLVKQLQAKDENGKDAIEPRRAAILAIGKCASDRTSAVELCDIGALTQLLSLMDTHWKQLGQVSGRKCPSAYCNICVVNMSL